MDCAACRGACCETFSLKVSEFAHFDNDQLRWLSLHGAWRGGWFEFERACTKLTPEGRCSIYEDRPLVCRLFAPGSKWCLEAVRSRRTPQQYASIAGPSDPPWDDLSYDDRVEVGGE